MTGFSASAFATSIESGAVTVTPFAASAISVLLSAIRRRISAALMYLSTFAALEP